MDLFFENRQNSPIVPYFIGVYAADGFRAKGTNVLRAMFEVCNNTNEIYFRFIVKGSVSKKIMVLECLVMY